MVNKLSEFENNQFINLLGRQEEPQDLPLDTQQFVPELPQPEESVYDFPEAEELIQDIEDVPAPPKGMQAESVDTIIAKNSRVPFVERIIDPNRFPSNFIREDGSSSSKRTSPEDMERPFLLMHSAKDDPMIINGKEKYIVYPSLRYDRDTKQLNSDRDPYTAGEQGNYIAFDSYKEAADFASGGWRDSVAWQSGVKRSETLPEPEVFNEMPLMSDPSDPNAGLMSFDTEALRPGMQSKRPTAVVNNTQFFLDSGPTPNPRANLSRQILETSSYTNEIEEEVAAESLASSIVGEAMLLDNDRPKNSQYARELQQHREGFKKAADDGFSADFITPIGDAWNYLFFEAPGTDGAISPSVEEYAEMLAFEATLSLDVETKQKVYKYLDRYLEASEDFGPEDVFLQSENVQGLGGKIATQLLQVVTTMPAAPVSLGTAAFQGRARNRNEETGNVNATNQLNAEEGDLLINLRNIDLYPSSDNIETRKAEVVSDAFSILEQVADSPDSLAGRPASVWGLLAKTSGRSYQPDPGSVAGIEVDGFVKLHSSDSAYILQPEVLEPWQKGLYEHIKSVHAERIKGKLPYLNHVAQNQHGYFSPEAIFERNKISAALSWVDAVDPDNTDSIFLAGYKPVDPPEGGWVSQQARKEVGEKTANWMRTGEGPFDPMGDTWGLRNEKREYSWKTARKIDQERIAKMAKEGAFGEAYQSDAGAMIAQIMTEITTQNKVSEFNSVLGEYASGMAQSFSPEQMAHDAIISWAGATGIGDPETVKQGEEFWKNYPVFAMLNMGVVTSVFSKSPVRPAVKGALKTKAAIQSAPALSQYGEIISLLRAGKTAEARSAFNVAMTEFKARYKSADEINMKAYEDAAKIVDSPVKRVTQAVKNLESPDSTVRISSDDMGMVASQKRQEVADLNAKANELEAKGDPMSESYRQKADVAEAYADALDMQILEEVRIKEEASGQRRSETRAQADRKSAIRAEAETDILLDQSKKEARGLVNLRKKIVPFLTPDFPTVRKMLAHLRTDPKAAKEYAQKLAAAGETDARVYGELLKDASVDEIADLVYRGETAPSHNRLAEVLDNIAKETNTTPEALMADQNRLSTADQLAQKGETRAGIYEALGLLDDQIDYFVSMGENKTSKPYVTSKHFGDGIEIGIKNHPHRGRFSPGLKGAGEVARRAIFGNNASHLMETAVPGKRTVNYGLAVAEFMHRPFSIVNIPSWYSDFVNWGLHNQLASSYKDGKLSGLNKMLEHTFMYLTTPSSMLGRDVYQQIRRAGGVQELAKAEIEAAVKDLRKKGNFELQQADVANALNELGLFNEEFGSSADLLDGLTSLREDEFHMMAEVIHRGLTDQTIKIGGVPMNVDSVMRLQVKRNGVWEDSIDKRSRVQEIDARKREIRNTLKNQLTGEELRELQSPDAKNTRRMQRLRKKSEQQIPLEQLEALRNELDAIKAEEAEIKSITQDQALSGVTELRWVASYDEFGQTRKYSTLSPQERQVIAVANNTVAPISNKIFGVVSDIILGEQAMNLSIEDARPRGVVGKETTVVENGIESLKYEVIKDFGSSKAAQEKAALVIKAAKQIKAKKRLPSGLTPADKKLAKAIANDLKDGDTLMTQTGPQSESMSRVTGENPLQFKGYEAIPRLANYVSSYFIREAEAGHVAKLIKGYKQYNRDVKNKVENPRGISPGQFKIQTKELARKYLLLIPDQQKVKKFVDEKAGKDTYVNNPAKALEVLMNTAENKLNASGIVFQGDSRYFKTRLWAKDLPFEKQLESLANYRKSATETYLGLVQRREALRLQTMFRENGLLVSKYELDNIPGINKDAYVSGKSIELPRLAQFATRFKIGKETVAAGGGLSDFYIHKTVARHYANQKVLFDAQQNFFVKLNNTYKIGAVVNPITGTIVRNLIGMFTFQSMAADIPFRGKYWLDMTREIQKVRRGEKTSDPIVKEMVEEGVLGNLILEFGDGGAARAAVEQFVSKAMAGKSGKGVAGEWLDALDGKSNQYETTVNSLSETLMGDPGAWNGLADNISLIRGSDDAYRPGQVPQSEGGLGGLAKTTAQKTSQGVSASIRAGRNAYGKIDDIGRAAYAMELIRDHGYTTRDAVMTANQVMFDYPDVSMFTSMIRTNPFAFGMPFIGYTVWANTAFGNLLARQTPRAYMMAAMAKAQISGVEALLGTPGVTEAYASTEYDPGGLPLPAIKIDEARGYKKTRLKGREYYGGVEIIPGQQFSAFLDTDFVRQWKMAEQLQEESLTAFDTMKLATGALFASQGMAGEAISWLASPKVNKQASNNELQNAAVASVDAALEHVKGDSIEDIEAITPTVSDLKFQQNFKMSLRNFPFFGAAIRGAIGVWSAATGEEFGGIGTTGREAITKFLGYSSQLYDPEFAKSLSKKGQEELRILKEMQKEFWKRGREVDVSKKANVPVHENVEKAIVAYSNKIGEQIFKMQHERGIAKAGLDFKVAEHLEKVAVSLRSLVRGGEMTPEEYQVMTGDSYFSMPSPKPAFDQKQPQSMQQMPQEVPKNIDEELIKFLEAN